MTSCCIANTVHVLIQPVIYILAGNVINVFSERTLCLHESASQSYYWEVIQHNNFWVMYAASARLITL